MSRSRKLNAAALVGLEDLPAITSAPTMNAPVDGAQLVARIPLDAIVPNPNQPRRSFDPERLAALAGSIREHGVRQPVLVRPLPTPGRYELVAGERRWRASELAGKDHVPAIIDGVSVGDSILIALAENVARDDLNPIEEARQCVVARDQVGLTVTDIARHIGRDRTAVSHLIRLLDLPDPVVDRIESGALTEGHGRVLLRLADYQDQRTVAAACHEGGWSVRQLEREVDRRLDRPAPVTPPTSPTSPTDPERVPEATRPRPEPRTDEAVADTPPAPADPPQPQPQDAPVQVSDAADEAAVLQALEERLAPVFGPLPVQVVAKRKGAYDIVVRCENLDAAHALADRLNPGGA